LGAMAMKWRVAFGNFDQWVLKIASRNDLLPRLSIVRFEPRDSRSILRFMGGAQRWGGDSYRVEGIDKPIDHMPDREYGAWLSQFYEAVATNGQPRYDPVTADMVYHGETGKPHRPVRYERLLLPWRTVSGDTLVTSCVKFAHGESEANLREPGADNSSRMNDPKSS